MILLIIKRAVFVASVLTLILLAYFIRVSPIAFQKAATLVPVSAQMLESIGLDSQDSSQSVPDVHKLIEPIPYREAKAIFEVLPSDRYRLAIEQGYGNCSNLTMGMAVYLLGHHYNFRVVHFLPYGDFLTGNGHTLLDMPYTLDGITQRGLVDMMEGGIPVSKNAHIDFATLQQKHLAEPSILPLNKLKDDSSPYYGSFLDNAAVGIAPRFEISRYFSFLETIYVPLGNKRLERIIYSGIGVVLNFFPHTYVSQEEYTRLFVDKQGLLWMAKTLLWLLRILPLLIVLQLISTLVQIKRRRTERCNTPIVDAV
ncbi:MAG: hypothetical protein QM709_13555 [Spongiibacteraceae bacterium]